MAIYVADGETCPVSDLSYDSICILSGGKAETDLDIYEQGCVYVSDGGYAVEIGVHKWGGAYISSGGSAEYVGLKGGELIVDKGGSVRFVDVSSRSGIAMFGGIINKVSAYDFGTINVSKGGTINTALGWTHATVNVSKGGIINDAEAWEYGIINVSKGGIINTAEAWEYGIINVSKGGTVNNAEADAHGIINVSKGGIINTALASNYGVFNVSNGGTLNNAELKDYGTINVSKGGTANDVTVYKGGSMAISGGKASGVTVDGEDACLELSNGTLNDLTVMNGGYACVYSSTVNDATVDGEDACLDLYGGTLNRATLDAGGSMYVYGSAKLNSATVSSGELDVFSGVKVSNVLVESGAWAHFKIGSVATNVTLSGGSIDPGQDVGQLWFDGTVKGLTIGSGTNVVLFGTATKVDWTPGDSIVDFNTQAKVSFTSKYSGIYIGEKGRHVASETRTKELSAETIEEGRSAYVMKDGYANENKLLGGLVEVWSGGTAESTFISKKGDDIGEMTVSSGGTVNVTQVSGGMLWLNGGSASATTLYDGGIMGMYGGSASATTIGDGGVMTIYSGSATGITVEKGGHLTIESGTATDVDWTPFVGNLGVGDEAHITFRNELTGIYIGNDGTLIQHYQPEETLKKQSVNYESNVIYVMSGGSAEETAVLGGIMYVFSGGTAVGTVLNGHGLMFLYDGAKALDTNVMNGELYVLSGGTASHTTVFEDGYLAVCNGGSAVDVSLDDCTDMTVCKGGFASDVRVSPGAYLYVESGGSLNSAVVSKGAFRQGGILCVPSGAVVSNIKLEYGAVVSVGKGAKVLNVSSSYGATVISEKGATVKITKTIVAESPDSDRDEKNGWKNKAKKTVNDLVMKAEPFEIDAETYDIQFDSNEEPMTFSYPNYVGYGDEIDFLKVNLNAPAVLSFYVEATDAAKFTIWQWNGSKMVSVQSTSLKEHDYIPIKGAKSGLSSLKQYGVITKGILLTEGEYYLSVESTNAAKGGNAYYGVYVNHEDSAFFGHGDPDDDKGGEKLSDKYDVGTLTTKTGSVGGDWVGYDDLKDYRRFSLEYGTKLSFQVKSTDAAKFTIWKYDEKKDKLVAVQSTTLKKDKNATVDDDIKMSYSYSYFATTAGVLLGHGTYYYSVESTNAAKGGNADYFITLNQESSEFFTRGVYTDDWTDLAEKGAASTLYGDIGEISGTGILFDDYKWVGFDDEFDYYTFSVKGDAKMSFYITADDAVKLTVFTLTEGSKGWKPDALLTATVKPKKTGTKKTAETKEYTFTGNVEKTYFISVQSLNAEKGGPGADYRVSVKTFEPVVTAALEEPPALSGSGACSLEMPESADAMADTGLNMQDELNFGQYAVSDVLADASASSLAELDDKSAWLNIATLA